MTIFATASGEFGDLTLDNTAQGVKVTIIKDGITLATSLLSAADTAQIALLDSIRAGVSGGGGSTVAVVDNVVMQDTDGTLFFKRVSSDTPPVLSNWKLADGTAYTITGTPIPYGVATVGVSGSVEITNDSGNPIPVSVVRLPTGLSNASGTITTGGTAQTTIAADAAGYHYFIQNNSTGDLWISSLATAVQSQPSLKLAAGDYFETPDSMVITGALSIIGATTGQAFTARKW